MDKIIARTQEEKLKLKYQRLLEESKIDYHPVTLEEGSLKDIVGDYPIGNFSEKNGKLYYQRIRGKFVLTPLSQNRFAFPYWEHRSFGGLCQFEFNPSTTGKTELIAHYIDGKTTKFQQE